MSKRVLLLSAPFGTGHQRAARAVAAAVQAQGGEAVVATLAPTLLQWVSQAYLKALASWPDAYRRLYLADVPAWLKALVQTALAPSVLREANRHEPDFILATHPCAALAAGWLCRRGALPTGLGVVITDFVPHPFWLAPDVNEYYVASPAARSTLIGLGVSPEQVLATGIPVHPAFQQQRRRRQNMTSPRRVLVMGGGLGMGPLMEAVRSLAALPCLDLSVTVVAGRNSTLENDLLDLFGDHPGITVTGYVDNVAELMGQADLLVTKPGGVTCSEALANGLPMLLLRPLPGQEEQNANVLCQMGVAEQVDEHWVGTRTLQLLYTEIDAWQSMAEAAARFRFGSAAADIAARSLAWRTNRVPQSPKGTGAAHDCPPIPWPGVSKQLP